MAGRSQDKKGGSSSRSKNPTNASAENPQLIRRDSQASGTSQSKTSQNTRKEKLPEISSSSKPEAATESRARAPQNLLWITTDQPADFKDPKIRHKISQHVMHEYLKDQSGKDPKGQGRKKSSHSSQSDEDIVLSGSMPQLPLMPIVERSRVYYSP